MTLLNEGGANPAEGAGETGETAASAAAATATTQQDGQTPNESAENKPAESSTASKAPESYADFTVPEGSSLPEGLDDDIKSIAKEFGLTQKQAQKVADMGLKHSAAAAAQQVARLNELRTEWVSSAKSDKEFGGAKFDANLGVAAKALKTFASPELNTLLQESGLGDHPEVIRLFYRIGSQISEDGKHLPANGSGGAPGLKGDAHFARTLYPNSN